MTRYSATPRCARGVFGLFDVTMAMQRGVRCGVRCHPVGATLLVCTVLVWQIDVASPALAQEAGDVDLPGGHRLEA